MPAISGTPGFQTGWTWSAGDGELTGLAMMVFESAENASGAGERIKAGAESSDDVTLNYVAIREVVASA